MMTGTHRSLKGFVILKMSRTKKLVLCGLLTTLVTIATMFLRIPIVIGYVNAGDGLILIASVLLGPLAGLVGGMGSALADILDFPVYAPATFIIKGLVGLLGGLFLRGRQLSVRNLCVFTVCELWMVFGYFLYEALIYSTPAVAVTSILPNLGQAAFGILLASAAMPACKRFHHI